jgi:hypothetical protein
MWRLNKKRKKEKKGEDEGVSEKKEAEVCVLDGVEKKCKVKEDVKGV